MPPSTSPSHGRIAFAVDRGGTFTDCIAHYSTQEDPTTVQVAVEKLLSQDPSSYPDASREGIRRLLERLTGTPHPASALLDPTFIDNVRLGTTVATNALLERKGERCALLITKGFKDLLIIGNQSRPDIFDLSIRVPDQLYDEVIEIDERVTVLGSKATPHTQATPEEMKAYENEITKGIAGDTIRIIQKPDLAQVHGQLQEIHAKGIRSLAICFLHAFTYPEHELQVKKVAEEVGFAHIHVSGPIQRIVPRAHSTVADAYLTPKLQEYTENFLSGFDLSRDKDFPSRILFMRSDGGLCMLSEAAGAEAVVSGPAGGVVGYSSTAWDPDSKTPLIGFDMGGTSTDVSRYHGHYEHVFETSIAGVSLQAPQLDIHTVAAGGGSRLFFKNGLFVVGPESAGAHPGPACYRKGGPLSVTDANLILGRLLPSRFPHIFGPNEDESLSEEASRTAFDDLTSTINSESDPAKEKTIDQVASGFLQVANEAMCRPIRTLTEAKGHALSTHALVCFGGAGGQHACAVATALGIDRVILHRHSSVLSAYGIALADVVHEEREPFTSGLIAGEKRWQDRLVHLETTARKTLVDRGFGKDGVISTEAYLNCRYHGTDTAMMINIPATLSTSPSSSDFAEAFAKRYKTEFGFSLHDREVWVDDLRVRAIASQNSHTSASKEATPATPLAAIEKFQKGGAAEIAATEAKATSHTSAYFDGMGRVEKTPVVDLDVSRQANNNHDHYILGPALLVDAHHTIVTEPNWYALILPEHVALVKKEDTTAGTDGLPATSVISSDQDPILLTLFGHRFMGIAEQMGEALRKTAISTNVKERLDFSCAIFGPEGGLIANAPHIPVHLGSLSHAVKWQLAFYAPGGPAGERILPGDVILTNHPEAGGSHLPDITVITPVFAPSHEEEEGPGDIVFFVASRAHHADIGGLLPGSMPPHSKILQEEGAAVRSFKIVKGGVFQMDGLKRILIEEPAKYPGCSGTRCFKDNVADLQAQIASNQKGIGLMHDLIRQYTLPIVHSYMKHIRDNAEAAVRNLLRTTAAKYAGKGALMAEDWMDDGSRISLVVSIDETTGSATFDFTGTSPQVYGNWNAPPAVTFSAIIYSLRCLVNEDIPLNEGCLVPVKVILPEGSFLSPLGGEAAVVGGNVMTSQRVVDVVLRAFKACAASQGDCNNVTFGTEDWGYYETIAGGSGAGPTWEGKSGVHSHMTNTRITDPEILESRYPVILHRFSLRPDSGGLGQHRGGDGCEREMEFTEAGVQVSLLTERRVHQPYGLAGGMPGASGLNLWIRQVKMTKEGKEQEQVINVGGKNTLVTAKGDRVKVCTPGGGGWGMAASS